MLDILLVLLGGLNLVFSHQLYADGHPVVAAFHVVTGTFLLGVVLCGNV